MYNSIMAANVEPPQPKAVNLGSLSKPLTFLLLAPNLHTVERTPYEDHRNDEECRGQQMADHRSRVKRKLHRQLDSEKPEQRRELDYWIHCDRRRVLERISDRIADHSRVVQRRAFVLQLDFDNLLRVVPRAAGVGHEDRLVQPKDRDRDQIPNEKERFDKCECKRRKEHRQEYVEHPLLGVLRADLNHLLAVGHRSLFDAFKLYVCFYELNSAVSAGRHSLS